MKTKFTSIILWLAMLAMAFAQTPLNPLATTSADRINRNVKVPLGKTFTIESGATFVTESGSTFTLGGSTDLTNGINLPVSTGLIGQGSNIVAEVLQPNLFASTATANGTTTLVKLSALTQHFSGTNTQNVVMPVVTTLHAGWTRRIVNDSTGVVTVKSSGANTILALASGQSATFLCKSIATDTTAAPWDIVQRPAPLYCAVKKTADQTITGGVTTTLSFPAPHAGTSSMWNAGTNTFQAPISGVVKVTGTLQVYVSISSGDSVAGTFEAADVKNGAGGATVAYSYVPNDGPTITSFNQGTFTFSQMLSLSAGDTLNYTGVFNNGGDDAVILGGSELIFEYK